MGNGIFDPVIGALNTSLNLRLLNQNVISSNVTNADTPGYKSKAVDFEGALRDALGASGKMRMETSDPRDLVPRETDPVEPVVYDDPNGVESLDGNTVDRATEMAKMAENQILYDASVEMLKKKLEMLKYGISEGGGNR